MAPNEHTLLKLSPSDLFLGPVRFQGRKNLLLDVGTQVAEDLSVLLVFVNLAQPSAQ